MGNFAWKMGFKNPPSGIVEVLTHPSVFASLKQYVTGSQLNSWVLCNCFVHPSLLKLIILYKVGGIIFSHHYKYHGHFSLHSVKENRHAMCMSLRHRSSLHWLIKLPPYCASSLGRHGSSSQLPPIRPPMNAKLKKIGCGHSFKLIRILSLSQRNSAKDDSNSKLKLSFVIGLQIQTALCGKLTRP